jgi:hypothetical protein
MEEGNMNTLKDVNEWKLKKLEELGKKYTTENWPWEKWNEKTDDINEEYIEKVNKLDEMYDHYHYNRKNWIMFIIEGAKQRIIDGKKVIILKRWSNIKYNSHKDRNICIQSIFRKNGKDLGQPCCGELYTKTIVCTIDNMSLKDEEDAELILRKCTKKYSKQNGGGEILARLNIRIKKSSGNSIGDLLALLMNESK